MISVVVPVLDDATALDLALRELRRQLPGHSATEIIVVDGGSRDGSLGVAEAHDVIVVRSPPGRGRQMNAGVSVARGDIVLFLHADTLLPDGALAAVERALASRPEAIGGGFFKRYDGSSWWLRRLASVLNQVRSRVLRGFVGTQAMFVRRSVFDQLGGFREWPLLEDVDLSDRMHALGPTLLVKPAVVVSGRRYRERGIARQIWTNIVVLGLFRLGVAPDRLHRLYRGDGHPGLPANAGIAVVIPTLNEASTLAATLTPIAGVPDLEVVVVDGGSRDSTVEVARAHGARVVMSARGRAGQLNLGAAQTTAEIILFLHADSRVDQRHLTRIRALLGDPAIGFGSFAIRLDGVGLGLRAIELLANLRTRIDRTAYGDQAMFVRRREFVAIGGYPDVPIAEDLILARRLLRRRVGYRFVRDLTVTTSARRWQQRGFLATSWRNLATRVLWELGVSPQRLRSFYDRGNRPE